MSLTDITIGATTYQSYASVAEADALLAIDPTRGTAWDALSNDAKGARLVAATRAIDLRNWQGSRTGDPQATAFPRTGLPDCDGVEQPTDTIPQRVEDATIYLAGTIELNNAAAGAGGSGSNIKRAKAGSAEVEFFRPTAGVPMIDEDAWALLKCFANDASGALAGQAFNNSDCSSFTDDDTGLNRGYA